MKERREVEEVKEGREKIRGVAAFFDLDGTLTALPSLEQRFFRMLRYRRAIAAKNYWLWLAEAVRLAPRGLSAIRHGNKMYLRGVAVDRLGKCRLKPATAFFGDALARVAWHAGEGHTIAMVSGTLEPLANEAARAIEDELVARGIFPAIRVCATRLEQMHGCWTGKILGEAVFGKAKLRAALRMATEMKLDLAQCYAYADSSSDRWLLAAVGRPTAVNPSNDLARLAQIRGWPVLNWDGKENLTQRRGGRREAAEKKQLPSVIAWRCVFYFVKTKGLLNGTGEHGEPSMSDVQRQDCERKEALIAWRAKVGAVRSVARAVRLETERHGIVAPITQELAGAWAACGAFEWIALGYLALSCVLIAIFPENLAHPMKLIGMQVFAAGVILILCRMETRAAWWRAWNKEKQRGTDRNVCPTVAQKFCHFWRHWYPHLFFLFCFEEMARLVHLFSQGWQDAKLIAFDQWLTGVNPTIWLERFAHPALNEFMQFAYLTYFVYLLIVGGLLYYQRDWKSYWSVMTYSAIGYVLGYVISMFFPVQSPWFSMAGMWHGELVGGPLTALVNLIEKFGRVHGAAFPSQHVAGAVAALWGAWRHRRWLFWVFLPFVLCMCVSTVYVRNHYVADVFGGMVTGTLGYVIGVWLMRKQEAVAARA